MRRLATLVLVSFTATLVRTAGAQESPPPACETVTTVRCSGSAAPLAVGGQPPPAAVAAPPAPVAGPMPMVPQTPPDVPRPLPDIDDETPPRCCEGPRPAPAATAPAFTVQTWNVPRGWRLSLDDQSQPVLERTKRTPMAGVWVPGLVVWLGTWLGTSVGGARDDRGYAAIPFFGALGTGIEGALEGDAARGFGYSIGGLLQVGGFVMFLAGLAGSKKIERLPVRLTPGGTLVGQF